MDRKDTPVKKYFHPYALAGIVPACFFLIFYFYPLSGIFIKSFFDPLLNPLLNPDLNQGKLNFVFLDQIILSSRMMKIIWFTFWQAGLSTLLTLVFALPCAFVMSHYTFRGKKIIKTLASIPFVLPAIVVATAFQACFGENSFFGFTIENPLILILLAHIFYKYQLTISQIRHQ